MNNNNKKHSGASQYFHNEENNWNCAQSLYKHYQTRLAISDEDIELKYRCKGGGRAEGGICGALYAGMEIVASTGTKTQQRVFNAFAAQVGGTTCAQIKGKCGKMCSELVAMTQELVDKELGK